MSAHFVGISDYVWIYLNKNSNCAPGNPPQPTTPVQSVFEDDMFVDAQGYEFLVTVVKKLNIDDDGVQFQQKIHHLLEKWQEGCPTSDDVEKSFLAIYQICLHDDELASKMAYLISSRTFISQKVRDKNIRLLFISQLQKNVDGSSSLHKTNPVAFRNCTRMLGEFFNKGRLSNGDSFSFMAEPLVRNLQILLENAHPQDLQLLATQLYMNGVAIKSECPEQLTKLLNDVRIKLISNELTKESKLWLLLCIDGDNNTFGLLSADLYTFYQDHIGKAAMAMLKRASSLLIIQTNQNNKSLDSYQTKVNVLQVSNPKDSSADKSSQLSSSDINTSNTSQGYTSGFVSNSSNHNCSTSYRRGSSRNTGKHDSPIVGDGTRLNKYKTETEASSTSRKGKGGLGSKPEGCQGGQSNFNVPHVSNRIELSIDKSSQFTSDFASDLSIHNSSTHSSRSTGKHDRPIVGVGARLNKYKTETEASSTSRKGRGLGSKPKGDQGGQSNSSIPQVSNLVESSTDKSPQFTSGFASDLSIHNLSTHSSRNTGKYDRPNVGVVTRLNRYNTDTESSSTRWEDENRSGGKLKRGRKNGKKNSKSSKSWEQWKGRVVSVTVASLLFLLIFPIYVKFIYFIYQ